MSWMTMEGPVCKARYRYLSLSMERCSSGELTSARTSVSLCEKCLALWLAESVAAAKSAMYRREKVFRLLALRLLQIGHP